MCAKVCVLAEIGNRKLQNALRITENKVGAMGVDRNNECWWQQRAPLSTTHHARASVEALELQFAN